MPKKKADFETGHLTICFEDGTIEKFDPLTLPETQQANLMLSGLSHKLGDGWAGKVDQAHDKCMGIWEALAEDRWTVRGENVPRTTVLLRALMIIDPTLDEAVLKQSLPELDKAKRKTIESNPRVASEMAKIKLADARERAEALEKKSLESSEPFDVASLLG